MGFNEKMTTLADAIRGKTNQTKDLTLDEMATSVESIEAGEDVTVETNTYTEKLATLETAITALETELQGKASGGSGGGSAETCTVKIINNIVNLGHRVDTIGYSYLDGTGNTSSSLELAESVNTQAEITLANVICGSFILLVNHGYDYVGYSLSGGVIDLSTIGPGSYFKAPTENGAIGIISIEDWD